MKRMRILIPKYTVFLTPMNWFHWLVWRWTKPKMSFEQSDELQVEEGPLR